MPTSITRWRSLAFDVDARQREDGTHQRVPKGRRIRWIELCGFHGHFSFSVVHGQVANAVVSWIGWKAVSAGFV